MVWRRLPTYLVNLPLRLVPFTEQQQQALKDTGYVRQVAFRTAPSVGKVQIKEYLEKVYGLAVEKVHTLNFEGRKKRSRHGFYRLPDFKKAYVYLRVPPSARAGGRPAD